MEALPVKSPWGDADVLWVVQCEVVAAEKASMASGLDAKDAQMERMQQQHSSVQAQLMDCQDRVAHLQSELRQVTLARKAEFLCPLCCRVLGCDCWRPTGVLVLFLCGVI